jgi:hypothetical protein
MCGHLGIETEAMNLQSLKIVSGGQTGADRAALGSAQLKILSGHV